VGTYAFDLRWHGAYARLNPGGKVFFHTESYAQTAADVHAFYRWVRAKHPDVPIFVLGHSNGGLIALDYGLSLARATDIRGFIVSSPWLKNKVEMPAILIKLLKPIAALYPTFSVKAPDLYDKLTHDQVIVARHRSEEPLGLRGGRISVKLGVESAKAQRRVIETLKGWDQFPLLAIIAGDDHLADPVVSQQALNTIPSRLLTMIVHPNNFHENFNELNRSETFAHMWDWIQPYLG
jgi:lysophospholipase